MTDPRAAAEAMYQELRTDSPMDAVKRLTQALTEAARAERERIAAYVEGYSTGGVLSVKDLAQAIREGAR